MNPLALTPGEPAGIGPDLAVLWAQQQRDLDVVAVGDPELLQARAGMRKLPLTIVSFPGRVSRSPGTLSVLAVDTRVPAEPGCLSTANAAYVLETLDVAIEACLNGTFAGLVTGPVQKSVLNDAGVAFSGHTEYLAARCGVEQVVMLLVAGALRVALVTTHVPLAEVAALITEARVAAVLDVLHAGLIDTFGLRRPRILVAGLNPHAGESGHLGREEIEVIGPALDAGRARGYQLVGPLPADTLFTPDHLAGADAVLAMYHDQGLPVLKHVGFGRAVNVTLGLPVLRTSVDHGTALDLAGRGDVDLGSLAAAIALAASLAKS